MIRVFAILFLMMSAAAAQQQQPDPATLQRYLREMQRQRDSNADTLVLAWSEVARLNEELLKLKARLLELEKPVAPDEKGRR